MTLYVLRDIDTKEVFCSSFDKDDMQTLLDLYQGILNIELTWYLFS